MMQCSQVREALAADPVRQDADLVAHLAGCAACSAYAEDMRHFDARIGAALAVPIPDFRALDDSFYAAVPDTDEGVGATAPTPRVSSAESAPADGAAQVDGVAAPVSPPAARGRVLDFPARSTTNVARRGAAPFAMAAGLVAVAVLVGLLWAGYPRETLAHAVVGHMAEEPLAWKTSTPVAPAAVAESVRRTGVTLSTGDLPPVTYLQSCYFRGHYVPHFVVQTTGGPVTVLVLADEPVQRRTTFDENGYRGVLVPSERGSVALLARNAGVNLDETAARVLASVHYVE